MAPHTPHDDIFDLVVSPHFADDQTVLAITRDMFVKSIDGGSSWKNIVHGLDNKGQLQNLAISHHDLRLLYVASQSDGIYRSTKGCRGTR